MEPPYKPTLTPETGEITVDDCIFATYKWKVPDIRPLILIIHGYRDNHIVYTELAETLVTKLNVNVFFFYQRGEGETRLTNGKLGITNDNYAYSAIDLMISKSIADPTISEIHLFGHSMGGGLVLNYACGCGGGRKINTYQISNVKSIVACAPLIELHPYTHPGQIVEWIVRFFSVIPFTRTLRVPSPLDVEAITGDPDWQAWMRSTIDPKSLTGAFIETRDFIMRGRALLNDKTISLIKRELPILVCHGDADKINDVRASEEWVRKVTRLENVDVTLKVYHEGRHSLMVDSQPIRSAFLKDVTAFFGSHLGN